jgi:pimeloyl-ACP methyl ester carboxylesterase
MRRISIALAGALLIPLLIPVHGTAASSRARLSYHVINGTDVAATPAELDRIAYQRHWFGGKTPRPPKAVVILIPGFFGGAEDFAYVGKRLVERNHDLQVWAFDRRSNFLENRCGMEYAQRTGGYAIAAIYYLNDVPITGCARGSDDPDPAAWNGLETEFFPSQEEAASIGMADWGLETQLSDLRLLVLRAHKLYPDAKVVLGGHSLGGMSTQLFAAWRFGPRPSSAGWKLLDGLVLIDGGLVGTGWNGPDGCGDGAELTCIEQWDRDRGFMTNGKMYWDLLDQGATYLIGWLAELGGMAASLDPDKESFLWSSLTPPLTWPDPDTCPTNEAVFAGLTDDSLGFSPTFMLQQGEVSDEPMGQCAAPNASRSLVGWRQHDEVDPPEPSSTDLWARALWSGTETNATEWFFPVAYNADIDLAQNLDSTETFTDPATGEPTTAAELMDQRVLDTAHVALPVFAIATGECRERFEWYRDSSPKLTSFQLLERSAPYCPNPASEAWYHVDPLYAQDTDGFSNDFIVGLERWLDRKVLSK